MFKKIYCILQIGPYILKNLQIGPKNNFTKFINWPLLINKSVQIGPYKFFKFENLVPKRMNDLGLIAFYPL